MGLTCLLTFLQQNWCDSTSEQSSTPKLFYSCCLTFIYFFISTSKGGCHWSEDNYKSGVEGPSEGLMLRRMGRGSEGARFWAMGRGKGQDKQLI